MMSRRQEFIGVRNIEAANVYGEGQHLYNIHLTDTEIIRCRDCKKMDEIQLETNQPCSTDPNGFCAWAVRKERDA